MNKIVEIKFGSHLYGTNTPNSDLDFKGVYLPTAREIVLGGYKKTVSTQRSKQTGERNNKDDVDTEYFSLDRYLELLCQGQTVALDMLFAPIENWTYLNEGYGGIWYIIYENKEKLITKNVNSFIGYSKKQAGKYGVKGSRLDALRKVVSLLESYPEYARLENHANDLDKLVEESALVVSLENTPLISIEMVKQVSGLLLPHLQVCNRKIAYTCTVKQALSVYGKIYNEYGLRAHKASLDGGRDYKSLSHAIRVNSEAKELLLTGHITFPRPDRELLTQVKTNQIPYEQVAEMIEQGLMELVEANKVSTLRDTPDQEWVDNFIYDVYSRIVRKS